MVLRPMVVATVLLATQPNLLQAENFTQLHQTADGNAAVQFLRTYIEHSS